MIHDFEEFLKTHNLCHGVGDLKSGELCSIASLNYCVYGAESDAVRNSESSVICNWVITIQDKMPLDMLNSDRWKSLLPKIIHTGQHVAVERARLNFLIDNMWSKIVPLFQWDFADAELQQKWEQIVRDRHVRTIVFDYTIVIAKFCYVVQILDRVQSYSQHPDMFYAAALNVGSVSWRAVALGNWDTVDPCGTLEKLIKIRN